MKTRKHKILKISKNKLNKYIPQNFSHLLGKVKGIDDKLMKIHFQLYNGLVNATNGALQYIQSTGNNKIANMVEYSSIQKNYSFFYNGMKLHEFYFGGMCGENMDYMCPKLTEDINKHFGSFAKWKTHFINCGTIPGVGFVVLCRDKQSKNLMNTWISDFDTGSLVGSDILLVMDMWEHAYIAEFGLNIQQYAETYLKNVNWSVVSKLYNQSLDNSYDILHKNNRLI
jgi:Fe-Mn family superoxide dismutase